MEFEQFKQGDLSVTDYVYQFNRLSWFAEESVDTDEKRKKKERFIRGLRDILHMEVTSQHRSTFEDAMEQAHWAKEEDEKVSA